MDVVVKWQAKITDVLSNQLILEPVHGGFGRLIFQKPIKHNFQTGDCIELSIEIAKEPPPKNIVGLRKVILYGLVRDVVNNGIVVTRWTSHGGIIRNIPIPMWEELLVIIDEKVLGSSPFYLNDCVRCKMVKVAGDERIS